MTQHSYRRGSVYGLRLPGFDLSQAIRNTAWTTEASREEVASDLLGPLIQPEEVVQTFSADSGDVASGDGGTEVDTVTPSLLREKGNGGTKGSGGGSGGGSSKKAAPTDITLTNTSVDENSIGGTLVGFLGAKDSDRKESFTFQLLDSAGSRFAIDGDRLVVAEDAVLDYEASTSHSVTIEVTDKYGLTYNETFVIDLVDDLTEGSLGHAPTDIALSDNQISRNNGDGEVIGLLSATDPDNDAPFSYRLIDDNGGRFSVEGDQLVVAIGAMIGSDIATSYSVIVEVTDLAGNTYSETMTIEVVADPADPSLIAAPDYVLDALLPGGSGDTMVRWNAGDPLGSAVIITYSFLQSVPGYYSANAPERKDFAPFTAEQEAAVRDALAMLEQFTNITFIKTTETIGDLAFGTADLPQGSGWAYSPGTSPLAGDIWLDNQIAANDDMTPGGDGFKTILHEIGHALGLQHPEETTSLPEDELNRKYTVMSYSEHPVMGGGEPTGYMLYDIVALQYLYGANVTATAGNDVYDVSNADGLLTAIWDAGGWDVLDASGSTRDVVLDLNQGAYSTSGTVYGWYPATDNIVIAYGTVIEEARGGSGNDVIVGNAADNLLSGGAGADVFVFSEGWGADVIADFEDGIDLLDFSAVAAGFDDLQIGDSGGSAVISLGGDMITLAGVSVSAVDQSDFVFAALV